MPIYEFKCKKCGKLTEQIFPITKDVNHIVCECGYISKKIMSISSFKINGYSYENGYSKEK